MCGHEIRHEKPYRSVEEAIYAVSINNFKKYYYYFFWKATDCFKDVIKSTNILNCHEIKDNNSINNNSFGLFCFHTDLK